MSKRIPFRLAMCIPADFKIIFMSKGLLFNEYLLYATVFIFLYLACYLSFYEFCFSQCLLFNKHINKCHLIFDCWLCLKNIILSGKMKSGDSRILFTSRKLFFRLKMSISFVFQLMSAYQNSFKMYKHI